jgi:hypothetical protein
MGTVLARHVSHQFQVPCSVRINHHRSFNGDVADTEGEASVTGIKARFRVFEEGTGGGEGIVSEGRNVLVTVMQEEC